MRRALSLAVSASIVAVLVPWSSHPSECSDDWPMYGHDRRHSFAASCSDVSQANVATLHPKWVVDTASPVTAQPAVVDGKLYVGTFGGTFYKVDAETGTIDWTFVVGDNTQNDYGKIVSSAAVDTIDGQKVVVFAGGATLYVMDADATAPTVLAVACFDPNAANSFAECTAPTTKTTEIEASPTIVHFGANDTRIVVGMDYNEDSNAGRAGVVSLQLEHNTTTWSLVPLWKFDPESGSTFTGPNLLTQDKGVGKGCGNVWSSPVVDQTNDLVVFGIGNCNNTTNAYGNAEAIQAIRLSTGVKVWRYEPRTPSDAKPLDLDFGASAQILPDGSIGEGGKDGWYYKLNPIQGSSTADVVWKSRVSTQSDIGGMIGSTAIGQVCTPSRLAPVPVCEDAIFATSAFPFGTRSGNVQSDVTTLTSSPPFGLGYSLALHAISAVDGRVLWHTNPLPSYSAATFTNGLVFISDTFGFQIQAYNADNGALMWAFPVNGAPSSGPTIVGDSIYVGSGTSASLPIPLPLPRPLELIGGIWAFEAVVP
jgi:outer membrane protein assembly factor BamB